ncbi:MAG: RluA family pseudouridine synthase, partial [Muribaculaceae bacterium]|nr:RluA family pseudouridine synthase [Muribaculaceae bacterium]
PLTGRTHQLRVHAASEQGLGLPIAGDRLYGLPSSSAERLHLHAEKIEFTFPLDGRHYLFELPAEF